MALELLGGSIERALREARFRNIWGQSFDASVMQELYAREPNTSGAIHERRR